MTIKLLFRIMILTLRSIMPCQGKQQSSFQDPREIVIPRQAVPFVRGPHKINPETAKFNVAIKYSTSSKMIDFFYL